MPITTFDMNTENFQTRRFEFRGPKNLEYYDGDFSVLSPCEVEVRVEKGSSTNFPIFLIRSGADLSFRRTQAHIRGDKANISIFWFIRRGRMSINTSQGQHMVQPGEAVLIQSTRPYYVELKSDGGEFEGLHVVAPTHELQDLLGEVPEFGVPYSTSSGEFALADKVLSILFEQDELGDPAIAQEIVVTTLRGMSKAIARQSGRPDECACESIADRRFREVTDYINANLSNSDLSAKMVAAACGISLRYLCAILKSRDTRFSTILWDGRLDLAAQWLRDPRMDNYSVYQIAYMAGYKNSTHFHRVFKNRFGRTAMEVRSDRLGATGAPGIASGRLVSRSMLANYAISDDGMRM